MASITDNIYPHGFIWFIFQEDEIVFSDDRWNSTIMMLFYFQSSPRGHVTQLLTNQSGHWECFAPKMLTSYAKWQAHKSQSTPINNLWDYSDQGTVKQSEKHTFGSLLSFSWKGPTIATLGLIWICLTCPRCRLELGSGEIKMFIRDLIESNT